MRVLLLFSVFSAVAVAMPAHRPPPPVTTEIMDIAKDGLGELGDLTNDLGIDIWKQVSDNPDDPTRKTIIKEAAEEAKKQVKASEKAEDFSRAQRKAEGEAREMPRRKPNNNKKRRSKGNTKRRSEGNKRQKRTRKRNYRAGGTCEVLDDSTVAEILKAARILEAAEESRRQKAREL